jgi:uncharacterized protein
MIFGISYGELAAMLIALTLVGCISGFLAGLLGIGGGIVIVPTLYYVLPYFGVSQEVLPHVAVGTSLATIIPTSIVSMRTHYAKGAVDTSLLKSWAPWVALGVVVALLIAASVKGTFLTAIFATTAAIVSLYMGLTCEGMHVLPHLPGSPYKQMMGACIGGFSALMGIGGGTLSVPILSLCNYPVRRAVGTASTIGLIISLPGTIGFIYDGLGVADLPPLSLGYVWLFGFLCIVPSSVVLAPYGARSAHTMNVSLLRKCFAVFLAVTSIRMLYAIVGYA